MKAIAAIVLIIGLLKFAQEAPELFKKLFSFGGGLLEGMDLNPRGKLRGDLSGAANTARGIGTAAKGFGHAVSTPFRGGAALGKGVAGAFQGAKAGGKEGGFLGGTRGLIAGARAGAHNQGFSGTLTAAANAGAGVGRISNKNNTAYGKAQSAYNTTVGSIMDVNKGAIDKQKEAKKALEAQHKADKAKYISDHINQHEQEYIERAVNNETEARLAAEAAKAGMTVEAYKQSKGPEYIESIKNAVMNDNAFMTKTKTDAAQDAAANRSTFAAQADAAFNPDFEAEKSKIDNKIAELQGNAFKEHMGTVQQAFTEFTRSKEDWGKYITDSYNANFESKMHDKNMDANIANDINDALRSVLGSGAGSIYAGNGANCSISDKDIDKLIRSIEKLNNTQNRTAAQDAALKSQTVALSQIMDNMNAAAKKTNTNISVAATAQNTYNPAPADNNSGGGKS